MHSAILENNGLKVPFGARLRLGLIHYWVGCQNGVLRTCRRLLYKSLRKDPSKILVFRTGSMGDSICAIPAINSIRQKYPTATIDILTNAGGNNGIGLGKFLSKDLYDSIIDYSGYSRKELFSILKDTKYDFIVQLPQVDVGFGKLFRDMIAFRLVASSGTGWALSQSKWFRKTQAHFLKFPDERTRLNLLLEKAGIPTRKMDKLLYPSDTDFENVISLFGKLGLERNDDIIAVVVGAKRPQNRWPIQYFKEVMEHFAGRYKILLIGSKEDAELALPVSNLPSVFNICGQITPMESAAALSLCKMTLSNDTGPMHLSYAVNTPTIAIFSSRDLPGKWYPPAGRNFVFRSKGILCEACFSEYCGNNICMQSILPAQIIDLMEKLLTGKEMKTMING